MESKERSRVRAGGERERDRELGGEIKRSFRMPLVPEFPPVLYAWPRAGCVGHQSSDSFV